jgi:hypothetical protein
MNFHEKKERTRKRDLDFRHSQQFSGGWTFEIQINISHHVTIFGQLYDAQRAALWYDE